MTVDITIYGLPSPNENETTIFVENSEKGMRTSGDRVRVSPSNHWRTNQSTLRDSWLL